MKLEPTCRYGHGVLNEIVNDPSEHRWGLVGATLMPVGGGGLLNQFITQTLASGRIFTVRPFRCPTCGYMEIFDDEVANG